MAGLIDMQQKRKYGVGNLTAAFWFSCMGFVCFLASVFSFYRYFSIVEKQRAHPEVNPVSYAGVLELLHYSWLCLALLGGIFPLIAWCIWRHRREQKKPERDEVTP
jgi:hypothetical protein